MVSVSNTKLYSSQIPNRKYLNEIFVDGMLQVFDGIISDGKFC